MSSRDRLGHLKFMQRAKLREEEKAKQDEAQASGDHWVANLKASGSSCVVIVEGDPKPSSAAGRMSFRSFNPSFEVSSAEAASSQKLGISSQETNVINNQQKTIVNTQKSTSTRS